MRPEKVVYVAAHGGFEGAVVPLGGGAAVFNLLVRQWWRTAPFDLETVTPAILGAQAPKAEDLVGCGERQYARFCQQFSAAATARVLEEDPRRVAVLVNDISEGPDFERLAKAGYRLTTIYHVDVAAYISKIYLHAWIPPWRLTQLWRGVRPLRLNGAAPPILRLIFEQQEASVFCSRRLIVPSTGMKDTLLRSYPDLPAARVHVLPWGCPDQEGQNESAAAPAAALRADHGVPSEALVLMTLSRISPEKGQDLLLRALIEWERQGGPGLPVWLFICGAPAYMQGAKFMSKLVSLASKLRRIHVVFPGYVTGGAKAGFLQMSDIFVFPSRHESYGLTLMEAMRAGLPCVALESDGAREALGGAGIVVPARTDKAAVAGLTRTLARLAGDPSERATLGAKALQRSLQSPFARAASELAQCLSGS